MSLRKSLFLSALILLPVFHAEAKKVKQFEWAAEPVYPIAYPVSEGLARVEVMKSEKRGDVTYSRGMYGYINTKGEVALEPVYELAGDFNEGIAWVTLGDKRGTIDKQGNFEARTTLTRTYTYYPEFWKYQMNGRWGFASKSNPQLIEPRFDQAFDSTEGMTIVMLDGKYGFVSNEGVIIEPQFEEVVDFSEGLAPVKLSGLWGYVNRSGDIVIKPQFSSVAEFHEERALVESNGRWGFIDRGGKMIVNPVYEDALWFSEGYAPVKIKNKWGFIDKSGKSAIDPQFDKSIDGFIDGIALVQINNRYGYIKKPVKDPDNEDEIGTFGSQIATVSSIKGGEIIIAGHNLSEKIFMGAWYIIDTGSEKIFIEATFPMMTTAKCRIADGDLKNIKPGMKVYRKPKRSKSN